MSKNIKNNIIHKIENDEVTMRPRSSFILGSVLSALGLFITTGLALLSIHLLRFRLTHPGLGAARKLDFIINTLPWYIPVLAIIGLVGGYLILKRYDFSYRKNLSVIALIIVLGLLFSSYLLDRLGINTFMARRGYFRQIYGQEQMNNNQIQNQGRGNVKGWMSR